VLVTPDEASAGRLLASYDYTRAARDALHFAALSGRFTQNLRRRVGYDVQYFAAALSRPRHRDHLMDRRAGRWRPLKLLHEVRQVL
jgi:hypothetical protein